MDNRWGGSRRARWLGVLRISLARLRKRAVREASGWSSAVVWMVALTIAILLIVTGVALALADGGAVTNDDADVHIIPAEDGTLSTVEGIERARLGDVNDRAAQIREHDGVDHASPLLVETVGVLPPEGNEPVRILAVGITPGTDPALVAGLPTASLAESADGPTSTGIVLSSTAASRLEAGVDDELSIPDWSDDRLRTYEVRSIEASVGSNRDVPIALMRLESLQSLSGADEDQLADRMLVWGDEGPATTAAEDAYPDEAVTSSDDRSLQGLFGDRLAVATSAVALVVGVTVCALFVATTAGMAVDGDRKTLAILEALGFSSGSRLAIVSITTLVTTLGGALLGLILGVVGIYAANGLAQATIASGPIARFHPLFLPYALGIALVAGLLALPYPLMIAKRTDILAEIAR